MDIFKISWMAELNELQRRTLIGEFYSKNMQYSKLFTVNYFTSLGFKRRTIYNVIKKIEDRKRLLRKKKISKIPSNVIHRIRKA